MLAEKAGTPAAGYETNKSFYSDYAVDLRSLAHDTALMGYLLDPAAANYTLEDLARRFLSVELTSPDRVEGTLDLDGDVGVEDTQRRASST